MIPKIYTYLLFLIAGLIMTVCVHTQSIAQPLQADVGEDDDEEHMETFAVTRVSIWDRLSINLKTNVTVGQRVRVNRGSKIFTHVQEDFFRRGIFSQWPYTSMTWEEALAFAEEHPQDAIFADFQRYEVRYLGMRRGLPWFRVTYRSRFDDTICHHMEVHSPSRKTVTIRGVTFEDVRITRNAFNGTVSAIDLSEQFELPELTW